MSNRIHYSSSNPNDFSLIELIVSDYLRYQKSSAHQSYKKLIFKIIMCAIKGKHHCFLFSMYLRLSSRKNYFQRFAKFKVDRIGRKYGIQIPSNTEIGPGLYIGHGIGIVINGKTKIGCNCNLSQFLTIGSNHDTPATIGNNVYIGPNVCIVEDVKIGNNVKIGAGTVVINDVPNNCTSVGNPNRNILKKQ